MEVLGARPQGAPRHEALGVLVVLAMRNLSEELAQLFLWSLLCDCLAFACGVGYVALVMKGVQGWCWMGGCLVSGAVMFA